MTGNLERLLQIEKDRQRIQIDLEIAREVQNQLYPQHDSRDCPPPHHRGAPARARRLRATTTIFMKLGEGDVAIAIGDVAGKGISAALLMATIQSSFRMELRSCIETLRTPADNGRAAVHALRIAFLGGRPAQPAPARIDLGGEVRDLPLRHLRRLNVDASPTRTPAICRPSSCTTGSTAAWR